jgi:hypothetical protein
LIAVPVVYVLMEKFTLFELHVHDGMEFSATNTAPAIGQSSADGDEEYEELTESTEPVEIEDAESGSESGSESESESDSDSGDAGRSVGPLTLLVGVVVLAVVAVAIRKLRGGDAELEIAELDDLSDETDEEEAEL